MNIFQALILGIVQGLTEFLPISSSAHLVITPYLLGWKLDPAFVFPFDVLVQVGTLVAVVVFFRKDIWNILVAVFNGLSSGKPFGSVNARLGWLIILATVPAGILGLFLKDAVEAAFKDVKLTALLLVVTAILLLIAEVVGKRSRNIESVNWRDALWIGFAQALSIFPGISRSGATISGGMVRQLDRPSAARFSFLMSIPIMLAAGGLSVLDLVKVQNLSSFLPSMVVGFIVSAIVGYLAIRWLLRFISKRPLYIFAIYCTLLAAVVWLVAYV